MRTKLLLISVIMLIPYLSYAGGGGCGDECPKAKITVICQPAGPIQITDANNLTDKWNQRSVATLKSDLAMWPLKIELLQEVWSPEAFDPKAFVEAWIEGLEEPETPGSGSQHIKTGTLEFHGTGTTGWETDKVEISRANGV